MGGLAELKLQTSYRKGMDDIAGGFYMPCMARATTYDRAVGFFNSTVYTIAWPSLTDFVDRSGKMRIVCSPMLPASDIDALEEGYSELAERRNDESLREDLRRMLASPYLYKPTRVLATLVSMGVVEIKIAFMARTSAAHRMFHDKVGIFRDSEGGVVVFKGSMNETWMGLSADGNLESIDVFASWEDQREASRVDSEARYFEALWRDDYPGVTVRPFPEVARDDLLKVSAPDDWSHFVDEICRELETTARLSPERKPGARSLLPHQATAIEAWLKNGRRGILEHATGSGKTFTALSAIRLGLQDHLTPIILVPSELLLAQWHAEVLNVLGDLTPQILICGGGKGQWRDGLLGPWTKPTEEPRVILATMQTACGSEFLRSVRQGQHLFVVADEVHRLGSPEHLKILSLDSGARLGLSATPRRAGDPSGTAAIFRYFGGVIPPPFKLADAIAANVLVPYVYHVHPVSLSRSEQNTWNTLSAKIRQLYARNARTGTAADQSQTARIKHLLIERSRVLKTAEAKVPLASTVLTEHYRPSEHWIVYCDSQPQLLEVLEHARQQGLPATEYHTAMAGDRDQTLRRFESVGGILVSIRCLDEGVDIPSVSHGLILASSKNPREFIQRRGRMLRKAPNKQIAHIHDAVVMPQTVSEAEPDLALLEGELARALEFGRNAVNPASVTDLQRIALRFGLAYADLAQQGYEDDSEK